MNTTILIEAITAAVFDYLLNQTTAGDRLISAFRRTTGMELDPERSAFQNALTRTFAQFKADHPDWVNDSIDLSFMKIEGASTLAQFLIRNGKPDPDALAERWIQALPNQGGSKASQHRQSAIPIMAHFLYILGQELKKEPDLDEINNNRAIEEILAMFKQQIAALGIASHTTQTRLDYLNWIIGDNEYLDPRGTLQTQRQVQLKLDEIYIGLRAQVDERPSDVDRKFLEKELGELEERLALSDLSAEEREEQQDALLTRLARQREIQTPHSRSPIPLAQATAEHEQLVILGDPGSGKTTLLRYLALQHAQAMKAGRGQVYLQSENNAHQPALFPILVRIADYAEAGVWQKSRLTDFLGTYFHDHECQTEGIGDLLKSELEQGGCLVLLDGLDEIVSADDRRSIVQNIENFVRAHSRGGPQGANRFIITSRIAGYRSAPVHSVSGTPFAHYVVEEMDEGQMERFLERWCRAVEDAQTADRAEQFQAANALREVQGIMDAIRTNPGVRRLASNPLMLRTLALIHRTGARLPQKRIELYKLAADTLARTWRTAQGVSSSALIDESVLAPVLGQLAYWMHEHKPTGLATEREVKDQLGAAFAKRQRATWDPDDPDPTVITEVENFLLKVREHTGLFVERAPKRYGFMHLTFEEYYAARHLVARSRTRAQLIRKHLHDPRWTEPVLLALGFVGLDYPDEAGELLETSILAQGEEAEELGISPSLYEETLARDYLFALRCLGDQIPAHPSTIAPLVERLAKEQLYQSGLARFQAYRQRLDERLSYLAGSRGAEQLAPLLLTALKDDDSDVRSRAAGSLGELGEASSEVITALIAALKDDEWNVRSRAAGSLGELGEASSEVITALIAALKDDEWNVRYSAAGSLGELGEASSEVITALIAALKDDEWNVRYSAAGSLGELGEASSEVITALIAALKDDDSDVRSRAAGSLVKLGEASSEVITALIAALKDDDSDVRSRAAGSLVKLGEASSEVITALIAALKDDDSDVRYSAAGSLVKLGEASSEVITALIAALKDDEWNVRYSAAGSLGELGEASSEVITALIAALKDDDSDVRYSAAGSLVKLGEASSEVITALIAALKDDEWNVRYSAAGSLGELGEASSEVITALIAALKDDEWNVRSRAAGSLVKLGEASSEVITALIAALKDDEWNVRYSAAGSLVKLGEASSEVITALIAALKDDEWNVRSRAAGSLVKLGEASSEVITALIAALKDDEWNVRYSAAGSLGELGEASSEVITALIAALKDDEWNVRYSAAGSLGELGEASSEVITALIASIQQAQSYQARRDAAQLVGEIATAEQSTLNVLRSGLVDDDDEVRGACATALAQLGKRFPMESSTIEEILVQAIDDPAFKKEDQYKNRTAQDYAYDGLWQLVVG